MPDQTTETAPGQRRRRVEFLARERAGDKTVLWRVGAWAGVAVAAVVVATVVANSPTGARHGALVAANSLIAEQHKQVQQLAATNERESRRLANAVETLNADRNRLFKRVTDLEHNLDTVTGSVSRFTSAAPPAPVQIVAPPANVAAPATQPVAEPVKADPVKPDAAKPSDAAKGTPAATLKAETTAPAASPKADVKPEARVAPPATKLAETVAGVDVPKIDVPRIEVVRIEPKTEPAKGDAAKPEAARSATPKPDAPKIEIAKVGGSTPEPAKPASAKPESAKPESAKTEGTKAEAPRKEPAPAPSLQAASQKNSTADDEPTGTVNQTQFGVDLGHASSVEGLRAIWSATRKMHGALVNRLQPIISIREQSNGMGMQLRLVAGPINDAAAAAKLCARIADDERPCRTAVYDGQRLAVRGDTVVEREAEAPPPRAPKPVKTARPERKPKPDAKPQNRFPFPFFSQQQ